MSGMADIVGADLSKVRRFEESTLFHSVLPVDPLDGGLSGLLSELRMKSLALSGPIVRL